MITKPSFIVRGPTPLVRLNSSGARNRNQIQINFQNFSYYAKKGLFLGFCFKVLQEIWHLRICTPRHMLKLLDPGCLELKWTSCRFSLSFGPLLHSFEASIFKYLPQRTGTAPTSRLELERMPANRQVFLPSSQFHDSIKPDFFGENRWWESLFFWGVTKEFMRNSGTQIHLKFSRFTAKNKYFGSLVCIFETALYPSLSHMQSGSPR